ncbi:hypothetical protein BJ508DRAFT_332656 [Ascobolus immersus RN42]|uniref:Uncharacterized protein n=1 Tax=Ascobolus immersus RN42 TaxID=1160509 RepID=A0A3N4HPI8_ASCIM|nr:hypothetical protein BJ508DRAFT_332656 [Ascobolus immersus RN42]
MIQMFQPPSSIHHHCIRLFVSTVSVSLSPPDPEVVTTVSNSSSPTNPKVVITGSGSTDHHHQIRLYRSSSPTPRIRLFISTESGSTDRHHRIRLFVFTESDSSYPPNPEVVTAAPYPAR